MGDRNEEVNSRHRRVACPPATAAGHSCENRFSKDSAVRVSLHMALHMLAGCREVPPSSPVASNLPSHVSTATLPGHVSTATLPSHVSTATLPGRMYLRQPYLAPCIYGDLREAINLAQPQGCLVHPKTSSTPPYHPWLESSNTAIMPCAKPFKLL